MTQKGQVSCWILRIQLYQHVIKEMKKLVSRDLEELAQAMKARACATENYFSTRIIAHVLFLKTIAVALQVIKPQNVHEQCLYVRR